NEAPDAVIWVDEVVADGKLRRVVHALASELGCLAAALVTVEELLREDDFLASIRLVAPQGARRQHQRDLARVALDVIAPMRLEGVDYALPQVAAGTLELEQELHRVAVPQPHVQVVGEIAQLASIV